MGKMNLLKANWDGKVGQTVGAKWKNKSTIRTFTKPSNPNTDAQQKVRGDFKSLTSFVALFADQIKYMTALDTSGMSLRNAIIKLNKEMIQTHEVDLESLLISKGGLQKPQTVAFSKAGNFVKVTFAQPTATNFTEKAEAVLVAVDAENQIVSVDKALVADGEVTGTVDMSASTDINAYLYFLDYRGSSKVASLSVAGTIA